jgi:hypothetical protein
MPDSIDLKERKDLARHLLSLGRTPEDDQLEAPEPAVTAALLADLDIPFPTGTAPIPKPFPSAPAPGKKLPEADVVAITWTVAERNAMADGLSPGHAGPSWYRYNRGYVDFYDERIREGAPSKRGEILGTYFPVEIAGKRVLCFKSELHLNQDGIQEPPHGAPGNATLPVPQSAYATESHWLCFPRLGQAQGTRDANGSHHLST